MIYSIIIWLTVKSNKRGKGINLYQTKYDVIYATTLTIIKKISSENIKKAKNYFIFKIYRN
jgi:hypothetical protein